MADKLIRTAVVMAFFLTIALFSGCGANETSVMDMENSRQITVQSVDVMK